MLNAHFTKCTCICELYLSLGAWRPGTHVHTHCTFMTSWAVIPPITACMGHTHTHTHTLYLHDFLCCDPPYHRLHGTHTHTHCTFMTSCAVIPPITACMGHTHTHTHYTFITSCAVIPPITACMGHRSPVAWYAKLFINPSSSSSCFAPDFSFTSLAIDTKVSASACTKVNTQYNISSLVTTIWAVTFLLRSKTFTLIYRTCTVLFGTRFNMLYFYSWEIIHQFVKLCNVHWSMYQK